MKADQQKNLAKEVSDILNAKAIKEVRTEDDPVSHPHHYTAGNIECIDYIDSCGYGLDFCLGNAVKYLTRCKLKGTTVQDIRKAIWYAEHAAEKLESGEYSCESK